MKDIRYFIECVIRYAGNAGDDYLADRAREALAKADELADLREENRRLRSALAVIREITGQDSVYHEADNALEGLGGSDE